jgi:phosphoglycolate phosphatase
MDYSLIIWDWNGTLLNDVEACVTAMNVMLKRRNMSVLDSNHYKKIFTFPVQDYYRVLGFDFQNESFEDLSIEYISLYLEISKESSLQIGAIEALKYFKEKDYTQVILSASEQKALESQVDEREISNYFDSIIGLNNIYARSKLNNALNYINNSDINYNQIFFIGDTYHDYEVSNKVGAKCILVENGHQKLSVSNFESKIYLAKNLIEFIEKIESESQFLAEFVGENN